MADEFNPQGVDQTPQNNEGANSGNPVAHNPAENAVSNAEHVENPNNASNPSNASDTGEQTEQVPFAGQSDAQSVGDASSQAAVPQIPTSQAPTQPIIPEPTPDYASAKGESTVVSGTSAQTDGPATTPLYRPAPEYGAYGPAPTQPQSAGPQATQAAQSANNQSANTQSGQPTQQYPFGQAAPQQEPGQQGNRNPYFTNNPFSTPRQNPQSDQPQQSGNGNPFNPSGPQVQQGQRVPQGPFGGVPGMPNGQGPVQPGQPNQPGNPARHGASRTVSGIVVAVVAALVAAALCLGVGYAAITNGWVKVPTTSSLTNVTSNKSGSGSATAKTGEAPDWQTVASDVSNSVVSIQTALSNGTAKGSGAIIDTEGHIITNNHVISDAQQIQVTLANGNMYTAQLVGTDTTTDLAVIKLDNPPSDLKAAEFADSDKLAVGEAVMAIGNPLGYDDTATTGIVSALNRPVTVSDGNNEIVTNAVQIDAAINPGNSGGPTFNAAGQVIGINSSIASTATSSDSAGSIGIGFAIPANLVKRVADEIIKDGSVKHVALGVTISSATVEADGVTRGGAKVTTPSSGGSAVVSGGPADKAGLKTDDTIVAFNGNAVNNNYSLLGFVRAAALGDKATLTIVRDGKTMDVDVTLDQEESSVNGSTSSDSNGNSQNDQNDQNGNGSNGDGSNGDGGTGDDGGFSDPFGLW
jgi:putative serine protease PepD